MSVRAVAEKVGFGRTTMQSFIRGEPIRTPACGGWQRWRTSKRRRGPRRLPAARRLPGRTLRSS